eukprot:TRINITY_DN1386_c0_g2_i1.p1 TRINITY_DN1386_c0_g2~~TRINITY_DN1386_c0_g2_i1.p1  ORF type:complete len:105 (-),score=13.81 TRINITY_DN1386_c0_g2_i1:102-416(-)
MVCCLRAQLQHFVQSSASICHDKAADTRSAIEQACATTTGFVNRRRKLPSFVQPPKLQEQQTAFMLRIVCGITTDAQVLVGKDELPVLVVETPDSQPGRCCTAR